MPVAKRAEFNRHLRGCPHCQKVVDEYSDIGGIIKLLPPHVTPSRELEDRTVAAMVEAWASQAEPDHQDDSEDLTDTRVYQVPQYRPAPDPETQIQPRPQLWAIPNGTEHSPSPIDQPASVEPEAPPTVTRLPVWRRHRNRLAAIVATAAAIIVATIVALSIAGRTSSQLAVSIPLHATVAGKASGYGAATGQATARQDSSGSWKISLTVAHLKSFADAQWYQCWYVSAGGQVASAGTFQVPNGGTWTFPMTSAVDPHDFRTMEITLGPPTKTGAFAGPVILSGQMI